MVSATETLHVEPDAVEAAPLVCFKPLEDMEGARTALIVAHAPAGRVKPNVPVYIAALRRAGLKVVLIAAGDQPFVPEPTLTKMLSGGFARENRGYDFAAWAHVLKAAPELWRAETLFLLNDSVIGPLSQKRLEDLLRRVAASPADVVGATENFEIEWHLQSYFLAFKRRALDSEAVRTFFSHVRNLPDKDEVIRGYEVPLTRVLTVGRLICRAAYPSRDGLNQTVVHWRPLIEEGFPFVKTVVLQGSNPHWDITGWRETLALTGFDPAIAAATLAATDQAASHEWVETRTSSRPAKRQAILVLGMHRSGTSAVAGVISALGAAAPKTVAPPDHWNPAGYFENPRMFRAFDEMLRSAGSHWRDWRPIDPHWFQSTVAARHRQRVKGILIEEYGDEALILIKDPRICRFVPFVTSILADLKVSTVAILPIRNPLEVAYSLKRRDGMALSKSLLLWLRYVLDAEFHSRSMPRCFVPYEEFLIDWRRHTDRAAERTGLIWPDRSDRAAAKIDKFLALDLRRERAAFDELTGHPDVTLLVRETYDVLTNMAARGENEELRDRMDVVRTKFEEKWRFGGAAGTVKVSLLGEGSKVGVPRIACPAPGHGTNFPLGPAVIDRDQPPLEAEESEAVGRFHDLYYQRWWKHGADTKNLSWLGYELVKCPLDLWLYQEILVRRQPDLVIETGTLFGGSALFMATVMDMIGHGRVITIDHEDRSGRPAHPRISYWHGSSIDASIVAEAGKAADGARCMVLLDSDHAATHVFEEIMSYSPLVRVGDYLIVEDTNLNGHPTFADFGPGPMEAVNQFLAENDEFVIDERCERFLMTLNPKGYLRRQSEATSIGRTPDGGNCGSAELASRDQGTEAEVLMPYGDPADDRRAEFHLALGEVCRLSGESENAESHYRAALALDFDLADAHAGLAKLRLPGDDYLAWLARLQSALSPTTYLEIGIAGGRSFRLAQPPTRAIGVDPLPLADVPPRAEAHIFCETSDELFARGIVPQLLAGEPLGLAFIDGAHVFQQSLKDFINVEAHCGPQSVVLLHDTIPLDEITQRPERQRKFYTGDIWKTVLCLKQYRRDLDIFTIATPPSGLTVVTGLDAASRLLQERYEEAVACFIDTPYSKIENDLGALNIVPNDWAKVEAHLKARGILAAKGSVGQTSPS